MKKIIFALAFLPALPALSAQPCDSSRESCSGNAAATLEETLSGKTEARPPRTAKEIKTEELKTAEKGLAAGPPEIPAGETLSGKAKKTFEKPGYTLLWLGIIIALYLYLDERKKKRKAGK
ncbi:MAG: hypothetical protein COT17_03635 [Elusimicrobia bacterium CG08_land_8_20_14_0_20_51_18]|nr:MAG: hypothetical protein COT17_03635 [Elusimicrobia bacterium CG08_land_8_20_14_0_20_51_18]